MGSTGAVDQKRTRAALCFWVLTVVVCAVVAWFAFRRGPEAKVTLLPEGTSLKSALPWPDRWIPAKWGWAWRLKQYLFGKSKGVLVEAKWLDMKGGGNLLEGLPEPDLKHTNGTSVWVLNASNFMAVVERTKAKPFENMSWQRIQTSPGVQARAVTSSGSSITDGEFREVAFSTDVVPKRTRSGTELAAIVGRAERLMQGEPVTYGQKLIFAWRTNVVLAAQVRIPEGGGVLVLDERTWVVGRPKVVVVISAKWQ